MNMGPSPTQMSGIAGMMQNPQEDPEAKRRLYMEAASKMLQTGGQLGMSMAPIPFVGPALAGLGGLAGAGGGILGGLSGILGRR